MAIGKWGMSIGLTILAALGGALVLPVRAQAQGPGCDENYDMACVPIASDVDCEGGGGNGPAYVAGPVRVIGRDVYRLDRDSNGYGCEPKGWVPPDD